MYSMYVCTYMCIMHVYFTCKHVQEYCIVLYTGLCCVAKDSLNIYVSLSFPTGNW